MKKSEALGAVKRFFEYKADSRIEQWKVMQLDYSGKLRGDCEDFALTTLYYIHGKNFRKMLLALMTKKAYIVECIAGSGNKINHALLEYDGEYVDNIHKYWRSKPQFRRAKRMTRIWILLKLLPQKTLLAALVGSGLWFGRDSIMTAFEFLKGLMQ